MSLIPLWSSVMLQSARMPLKFSPSKSVKLTANNSKFNEGLMNQMMSKNTVKDLSVEAGWYKADVVLKEKYFFLANIGTVVRKLTPDEFKQYDCGSIHRLDEGYCVVLGMGDTIYHNKLTGEIYSVPVTIT